MPPVSNSHAPGFASSRESRTLPYDDVPSLFQTTADGSIVSGATTPTATLPVPKAKAVMETGDAPASTSDSEKPAGEVSTTRTVRVTMSAGTCV